ncbi:hypothetical protein QJS04_geneDACA002642 [Acorus gramineus]|uniref:Uncharacterized protein n=1 Tax=Acorus gramineus TaxID=55184 RepID=A0AAV9APA0_ACOGR|nr:hypothetical protein QJS04_geneDACA002642 [Acorus gramineus]
MISGRHNNNNISICADTKRGPAAPLRVGREPDRSFKDVHGEGMVVVVGPPHQRLEEVGPRRTVVGFIGACRGVAAEAEDRSGGGGHEFCFCWLLNQFVVE